MKILRPYQQEAVETAVRLKRGTIKAATGTGKTIIAIEWIRRLEKKSLIVVPTQALIFQSWAPKLEEAGLLDVGQYYAYAKRDGRTMITTYSSALSHSDLIERADAVVLDEIHHLGAQAALQRLLPKLLEKEFVLGLSSVPERGDATHELFLENFPICFDLSLGDALRRGIVSPLEIIPMPVEMTENERKRYDQYTERIQNAFRKCGPDIGRWMKFFDPATKQFVGRQGLLAMSRRKKLLSQIQSKKEKILEIIQRHPEQRVILFAESVEAIEEIKAHLHEEGIMSETYHSRTEPWRRMEILQEWGRKFDVLLSCRALEEGVDVSEVSVGVLIASGKSKRQFIQRIGRVIRKKDGKIAKFHVVFCKDTVEHSYIDTIEKILRE